MKFCCILPALIVMPALAATFESSAAPFLAKNCVGCHNAKLKSGELDLQPFRHADSLVRRDAWERIVQKIRSGEMPPKGLPRPPQRDVQSIASWVEAHFERVDREAPPDPGRVTARRLNRYEYDNTIRDLTGVPLRPAEAFPPDDSGYGFDSIGDVLSVSPVLMEKYLAAAEQVARAAIAADPVAFRATRVRYEGERIRSLAPLAPGEAGPKPIATALHARHHFPAEAGYDVRFSLGGVRNDGVPDVRMRVWIDGIEKAVFTVNPGRNQKRAFDIDLRLPAGFHTVGAAFVDDAFEPDPVKNPIQARDRYLAIEAMEIRGPFNAAEPPPPESHKRIMICGHAKGAHESTCARRILQRFAGRAFRRPASEEELAKLMRFVEMARADGDSLEHGIRLAVQAALVSPHFLFRIERNSSTQRAVTPHELASRLSYFLWSSMPDAELSALADSGSLREPTVLRAQIRRMLRDPKSRSLAENFAGQWLELRNLDTAKPDPERFPQFDDALRAAMKQETELFFEAIVREDRSILEFLDAKFTFLNERLAQHYGIEGVRGAQFRRVPLTTPQRGGVLTHASVLTVSSYPARTSPVIRGKWILDNLLAAPPPPAPPDVPNLDEDAVGSTGSLRQQLEKHRNNAVCASCHARMDPLGFGLENYDAIGAWRTNDGKFPVDAAGVLPNGARFSTPEGLKRILRAEHQAFSRALAGKLLTYALGRGLERYDKAAVNSISRGLSAGSHRFSRLVEEIVTSMPFQMRRGEELKVSQAGRP